MIDHRHPFQFYAGSRIPLGQERSRMETREMVGAERTSAFEDISDWLGEFERILRWT
jgi:hypothetical protein